MQKNHCIDSNTTIDDADDHHNDNLGLQMEESNILLHSFSFGILSEKNGALQIKTDDHNDDNPGLQVEESNILLHFHELALMQLL